MPKTPSDISDSSTPPPRWLVLCVRPRYERRVDLRCQQAGITRFLPLRMEVRQWSDRKKMVEVPLFPGYLFVRVRERERIAALEIDGALHYVVFGGRPAVVPAAVMDGLRALVASSCPVEAQALPLQPGRRIRVLRGPLCGVTGELLETRGSHRLLIRIDAIGQAAGVEVGTDDIETR